MPAPKVFKPPANAACAAWAWTLRRWVGRPRALQVLDLLDARRAISVTERQRYILRVRALAQAVAKAYYEQREKLGFPGAKKA